MAISNITSNSTVRKITLVLYDTVGTNNDLLTYHNIRDIAVYGAYIGYISASFGMLRFQPYLSSRPDIERLPDLIGEGIPWLHFVPIGVLDAQLFIAYPGGKIYSYYTNGGTPSFTKSYDVYQFSKLYRGDISTDTRFNSTLPYRSGPIAAFNSMTYNCTAIAPLPDNLFNSTDEGSYECFERSNQCQIIDNLAQAKVILDNLITAPNTNTTLSQTNITLTDTAAFLGSLSLTDQSSLTLGPNVNSFNWTTKNPTVIDTLINGDLNIINSILEIRDSPLIQIKGTLNIQNSTLRVYIPDTLAEEGSFYLSLPYRVTLLQAYAVNGNFDDVEIIFDDPCYSATAETVIQSTQYYSSNLNFNYFFIRDPSPSRKFMILNMKTLYNSSCRGDAFDEFKKTPDTVPTSVISTAFIAALGGLSVITALVAGIRVYFFDTQDMYDKNRKHDIVYALHVIFLVGSTICIIFDCWGVHKLWNMSNQIEATAANSTVDQNFCCVIDNGKDTSPQWISALVALIVTCIFWIINVMAFAAHTHFIRTGMEAPSTLFKIIGACALACELAVTGYILYLYISGLYISNPATIEYSYNTSPYPATCFQRLNNTRECFYNPDDGLCSVRVQCQGQPICQGPPLVQTSDPSLWKPGIVENCLTYWVQDTLFSSYSGYIIQLGKLFETQMIIDLVEDFIDIVSLIIIFVFFKLTD